MSIPIKLTIPTQAEREREGCYRSIEKYGELYKVLEAKYKAYITRKQLQQYCHEYNTHKNEGMNTCVTKYAPKTHNYVKSCLLETRVKMSAGVYLVGYHFVRTKLFNQFDFEVTPRLK